MSAELLAILGCCILGLLAHGSRHQRWLEWLLRGFYMLVIFGELLSLTVSQSDEYSAWTNATMLAVAISSFLILFKPIRSALSYLFTAINQVISGQVFLAAAGRLYVLAQTAQRELVSSVVAGGDSAANPVLAAASETESTTQSPVATDDAPARRLTVAEAFLAERVFIPASIPHLNGAWIYIAALGYLVANSEMRGFQMPSLPIPFPVTIDQLVSYNGLGLVMLALCGVGIMVARKPLEAFRRLGLVKPTGKQVALGVFMIVFTFFYDYTWSVFTHGQSGMDYADKLTRYNEGTFSVAGGSASPAFLLALFTGLCAGIGEETLIRGGLQPAFGIFPAAFLHGALHGQFAHAPLLILQVAGWSTIMGIVKRYTNTTTTIITHAGFNFLSSFLFAFNP